MFTNIKSVYDLLDKVYILLLIWHFSRLHIYLAVNVDKCALTGLKKIYPKQQQLLQINEIT